MALPAPLAMPSQSTTPEHTEIAIDKNTLTK